MDEVTIGACRLIRGDALAVLPTLEAVDALLTDPPYGLAGGARHGEYRHRSLWKAAPLRTAGTSLPSHCNQQAPTEWITLALTNVQWAIIWGGNYFALPLNAAWLVWDKCTTGQLSDCELAWTNLPRDSVRKFTYLWNGFQKAHPEDRWHPTQKPVALMHWCLDQFPAGITTVLDPFAGSGTVGVACMARGQHSILIERDPNYCARACRRIAAAYAQLDLFVPQPALPPQQLTLT